MRHPGRAAWLLFAVAVGGNLILLFWPRAVGTGGIPHLDKAAHAVSFAVVMWSGVRAGVTARLLALVLTVHAFTSEVIQDTLLAGRSGDPADVLADLGGITGVVLALGAASWRHERSGRQAGDGRAAAGREPHVG